MPGIRRLKQLEKQLASLDGDEAMLLTELDGFLAGILVRKYGVAGIRTRPPFSKTPNKRSNWSG
jgi:hypothetical protein